LDIPVRSSFEHLLARLRFRHLQLLTEIEQTGSISRAALSLNLTQPALSKALRELEQAIGFPLFLRGPRGLQQTAQGALVTRGAALLLRQLESVHGQAEAAAGGGPGGGLLRLGAPAFVAVSMLPAVIRKLTAEAGLGMQIQLREASVPQLMEDLQRGDLDALVSLYDSALMTRAGVQVIFERFAHERYTVIAPRGHPLARQRNPSWGTLRHHPWVLTRKPSFARVFVEDHFRTQGVEPPTPVCETDGPITASRFVAAGIGLSCVPEITAREAQVEVLNLHPAQLSVTVGLVHLAAAVGQPHILALRKALQ